MKTRNNPKESPAPLYIAGENLPEIKDITFHMPPGVKFPDVYMDAQDVTLELNISKRTLRSWRTRAFLSFTSLFGKIFYFRQEIAGLLKENLNVTLTTRKPKRKAEKKPKQNKERPAPTV